MDQLPDPARIEALHRKHAPTHEAFDLVYTHCQIVAELADQLLRLGGKSDTDRHLVRAGCLLHDIGVYRLYGEDGILDQGSYVRHGILGHEIAREEGFSSTLCRFCSCHTGVGLTKEDVRAQQLPLPVADYVAITPEERLVMYADKFHTKANPPKFLTAATCRRRIRRFGEDKAVTFDRLRDEFGEPDLGPLATRYHMGVE
jgi:uncharacterized protein